MVPGSTSSEPKSRERGAKLADSANFFADRSSIRQFLNSARSRPSLSPEAGGIDSEVAQVGYPSQPKSLARSARSRCLKSQPSKVGLPGMSIGASAMMKKTACHKKIYFDPKSRGNRSVLLRHQDCQVE